MPDLRQALRDFVTTSNSGKYATEEELMSKFPELQGYDIQLLRDFVATSNSGKYSDEETLFSKFPEFGFGQQQPTQQQPTVKKKDDMESDWLFGDGSSESEPSKTEDGVDYKKAFSSYNKQLFEPKQSETDVFSRAQKVLGIKQPQQEQVEPKKELDLAYVMGTDVAQKQLQEKMTPQREEYLTKPLQKIEQKAQFEQKMEKIEEATPEYLRPSIKTIEQSVEKSLENFVGDMNYQFGDAGFEFKDLRNGYFEIKAPDGTSETIRYHRGAEPAKDVVAASVNYFVKTKSAPLKGIERIEKLYKDENKKFATEYQVESELSSLSKEQERTAKEASDFLKRKQEAEAALKAINELPFEKRTVNYRDDKFQAEQILKRIYEEGAELQKKIDAIPEKQKNLEIAVGRYNSKQEKQGTWVGGIYNSMLSFIDGTIAGFTDIATDYVANFNPLSGYMTAEQKDKLAKDIKYGTEDELTFMEASRNAFRNAFGDKNTTEQWEALTKQSFIGGAVLGAAEFVPSMLIPGAWFRRAAMYASVNDMVNQEFESNPELQNISENEKLYVKVPIGIVGAVLEEYGLKNIVQNTALVKSITGRAILKAGAGMTPTAFKKVVSNEISEMIADGTLRVLGGGIMEFETGAAQQGVDITVKSIFNAAKGKKLFDTPDTIVEIGADMALAGAQEMIGSVAVTTPMVVASAYRKKDIAGIPSEYFNVFVESASDKNAEKAFIATLKNNIISGDMTNKEAVELLNNYRNSVGLLQSIPPELNNQEKKQAMSLLRERKELESKTEGKDPALVKPIQNRIDQINEQLSKLTEDAIQKQAAGQVSVQPEAGAGQEVEVGGPEAKPKITPEESKRKEDLIAAFEDPKETEVLEDGKPFVYIKVGEYYTNKEMAQAELDAIIAKEQAAVTEQGGMEQAPAKLTPEESERKQALEEELEWAALQEGGGLRLDLDGIYVQGKIISLEDARAELDALNQKEQAAPAEGLGAQLETVAKEEQTPAEVTPATEKKPLNFAVSGVSDGFAVWQSNKELEGSKPRPEGIEFKDPRELKENKNTEITPDGSKTKIIGRIEEVREGGKVAYYAIANQAQFEEGQKPKTIKDFTNRGGEIAVSVSFNESDNVSMDDVRTALVEKLTNVVDKSVDKMTFKTSKPADLGTFEFAVTTKQAPVTTVTPATEVTTTEVTPAEQFTEQDRARKAELEEAIRKADKRRKNITVGETTMSKAEAKAELDALVQKEQAVIEAEVQAIEQLFSAPKQTNTGKIKQAVTNAAKAIAKILPKTKIVIHETNDDYVNATGDTDGASGIYIPSAEGGTIHVNLSNANTRTVGHEVFHAILLRGIKTDAEAQRLAKAMIGAVAKSLKQSGANQELLNELEGFLSNYEENIQNEEYLAEVFGYLADGYPQLTAPEKSIINRFIERIMKLFGLKPMTDKEVIDFMNTLSRKIATGEEITEKEAGVTKKTKGISNITKRFQANFIDPISKLSFVYDKNSEKFENLKKQGFITTDKSLSDFNGKYIFLHQPDAAFSGMIYKNNELLVEGKGGVFYPIKFHDDGYFWASTSKTAKTMADQLNAVMQQNGGTIYMALTSAPYHKLMSSTTMSNAVLDFFASKAFDKNFKISEAQLKSSLIKAGNDVKIIKSKNKKGEIVEKRISLNLNLTSKMTIEEIKSAIKTALNPDVTVFDDRKNFALELTKLMATEINKNDVAVNQFGKLFSEGIQNKYFKGITKTGKLKISAANMTQALSEMFTEPMLKEGVDRDKGGQVYAILELNGAVEPFKTEQHESYPMAIKSSSNSKVKVHVLTDRQNWYDVFEDPDTNEIVTKDRLLNVFPTSGVSNRGLKLNTSKVKGVSSRQQKSTEITTDKDAKPGFEKALNSLNETEQQREEWRKKHKVNQKQKRNPIVEQAVKDYYNEKITQEEYLDIVSKNQPIKSFKNVPKLPTLREITNSLDSSKVATGIIGLTKNLEDGEKVACRLDIPAYEDFDTWVVSIHDGNKEGKSIAYGQTAVLKNVNFKTFPGPAMRIAMGTQNKSTIARMFGDWINENPESVHERAKELMNDPAWTQVGMNPFRYSWFYDKADGMPISTADEVIQVGALVLAKNAKKVSTKDIMFETKSSTGLSIRFQKNNSQEIIKQARANGISEAGIRAYFKKNGLSDIEIDTLFDEEKGAGKKIILTEETLPGYTKLMSRINDIIERGRRNGKTDDDIMKGVIANIESRSPEYANATDQQREQIIRDIRKLFGKKEKAAPSAEKITGKPKPKKVTVNEMTALKDQIRLEARAAREAKGDLNAKRKMLAAAINEMEKKGSISARQAKALINRVNAVNLDNPVMVERLLDYAEKVFNDAAYAEKLSQANKLQSQIKQLSKNKEKFGNLTAFAAEFAKIDPALVEDIDEYIEMASNVKEGVQGSKVVGEKVIPADMVDVGKTMEYVNKTMEAQEETIRLKTAERLQELIGVDVSDLSMAKLQELMELVKAEALAEGEQKDKLSDKINEIFGTNKDKEKAIRDGIQRMFDTYSTIIKDMFETGIDPFSDPDNPTTVEFKDSDKKIVEEFMDMDLSLLDKKEALRAADALNNFLTNKSTAGMLATLGDYNGRKNVREVVKEGKKAKQIKMYWSPVLGRTYFQQIASIPAFFERLFKSYKTGRYIREMMGLNSMTNHKAEAIDAGNRIINKYLLDFSNKTPNKKSFQDLYNIIERDMIGSLGKTIVGDAKQVEAEFNRRKKLIEQSIEILEESGTKKELELAKTMKEVYNKIAKDAKNIEEVKAKADKTNVAAVKFWIDTWAKLYDQFADVALNVYNRVLDKNVNFVPDRFGFVEGAEKKSKDGNGFDSVFFTNSNSDYFYKKEAGSLMKSTPPQSLLDEDGNSRGMYVDMSFDTKNANALIDALIDIKTAADIRQVQAFVNDPGFKNIFPFAKDRTATKERIAALIRNFRNKRAITDRSLKDMAKRMDRIAAIGTSLLLAGPTQAISQTIPVAINTIINSGGKLNLSNINNKDVNNFINNSGMGIANRGSDAVTELESLNQKLEVAAKTKGGKLAQYIENLNKEYLKLYLSNFDVFIARASWITYYEKGLRKQGIKEKVDYSTHKMNKEAAQYAQDMIDRQQNISDKDLAGQLYHSDVTWKQFIVKIIMPLSTFRMNQTTRFSNDLAILSSKTSSTEEKKEAAISIGGFAAEMATFRAIKLYIGYYLFYSLAQMIRGEEDDEEEKQKTWDNMVKGAATSVVSDVFSPIPMTDTPTKDIFSGVLDQLQNIAGVGEGDKFNIFTESKSSYSSDWGLLGVGIDKMLKLGEKIELARTGKFKDEFGNEKTISESDRALLSDPFYIGINVATVLGINPFAPETDNVMNRITKMAKKNAMSNEQLEEAKELGIEGKKELMQVKAEDKSQKQEAYGNYKTLEEFEKKEPEKFDEYSAPGGKLYKYREKERLEFEEKNKDKPFFGHSEKKFKELYPKEWAKNYGPGTAYFRKQNSPAMLQKKAQEKMREAQREQKRKMAEAKRKQQEAIRKASGK